MTDYPGRLVVHDREIHLELDPGAVAVGDTVPVIRGNGPREGDHMGTATVTAIVEDGPVLDVRFDGQPARLVLGGIADDRDDEDDERPPA